MTGSAFALLSAFLFAASNVSTRRGVVRVRDASLGGYVSSLVAPPLLLLVALVGGDLPALGSISWRGYAWLALAGIVHFVLGRTANYSSVQRLGANITAVFVSLSLVYNLVLSVVVLREPITRNMLVGSGLIMLGPTLLAWRPGGEGSRRPDAAGGTPRVDAAGVGAALLSGLFFGLSPLFIKLGMTEGSSALNGALVSHASAALVLGAALVVPEKKEAVLGMDRRATLWFVVTGVLVALAQLARYAALRLSPVNVVAPLTSTIPVFLLALSFALNRRAESFRPNVLLGSLLVVVGAALVYR